MTDKELVEKIEHDYMETSLPGEACELSELLRRFKSLTEPLASSKPFPSTVLGWITTNDSNGTEYSRPIYFRELEEKYKKRLEGKA